MRGARESKPSAAGADYRSSTRWGGWQTDALYASESAKDAVRGLPDQDRPEGWTNRRKTDGLTPGQCCKAMALHVQLLSEVSQSNSGIPARAVFAFSPPGRHTTHRVSLTSQSVLLA